MAGCGWFGSEEPEAIADFGMGPADPASSDGGDQFTGIVVTGESPTATANPQRGLADPYYIVGQQMPPWDVTNWANHDGLQQSGPIKLEGLKGNVVVVRFWSDGSDVCARTMPAMQQLAEEFRGEPVVFIGIFSPENSYAVDPWGDAQSLAHDWGVTFPIAEDASTLNTWWRSRYDNLPNTPTFVIGPDGHVVHLHPGPEFFPSDEVADQICDDDYHAMKSAIAGALNRQLAESRADG